jgi:hypothetical protein
MVDDSTDDADARKSETPRERHTADKGGHPQIHFVEEFDRVCRELQARRNELEDVDEYLPILRTGYNRLRAAHADLRAHDLANATVPPDELVEELRYFGWALFEAALVAINKVTAAYVYLTGPKKEQSERAVAHIAELADMARGTPWPEFSLRGLGALRSLALAYSKQDSIPGYKRAWTAHTELESLLDRRTDEIESGRFSGSPHHVDLKRDLDEMWEQHYLSKTGTSCREPEYLLCRWAERVKAGDFRDEEQTDIVAVLAHRLRIGIMSGEATIESADHVYNTHEFTPGKDSKRLLGPTSMQNPGIMAARAYLLLIPMCPLMESYEHRPFEGDTWDAYARILVAGFKGAYARIEHPYPGIENEEVPFIKAHLRSLVQLRLAFRILCPDQQLPTILDENILGGSLDLDDVEDMSAWLEAREDDANVISSATMPAYIVGIEQTRAKVGVTSGYRSWRRRWPALDRFGGEPGRGDLTGEAIGPDGD